MQCTPQELATLLESFVKVAKLLGPTDSSATQEDTTGAKSPLWRSILASLPRLSEPLKDILGAIKLKKAQEGSKIEMWTDTERYPEIADADVGMQGVEIELEEELVSSKFCCKPMKRSGVVLSNFS